MVEFKSITILRMVADFQRLLLGAAAIIWCNDSAVVSNLKVFVHPKSLS